MLRLCDLYPGICLEMEEKAWKNFIQSGRRAPVGTMKQHIQNRTYIKIRIHKHNKKTYKTKQKYTKHTTIYPKIKLKKPKEHEAIW